MKKLKSMLLSFGLFVFAVSNAYGQYNFELVMDIRTPQGGSSPKYFTEYDGKLYFSAYNDAYGEELWCTDGTTGGTQLFMDINQGDGGSNPNFLTVMNHMLYFTGYDPVSGSHLWASNGSPSGTQPVVTGDSCISPYYLTVYKDRLYFSAFDNNHGYELWVSDGSAGGTRMVKDINTRTDMGNGRTDDGSPSRFVVYNNLLYFCANDGVNGNELWVTDGTEAGTHMVKDINPGKGSSAIIYAKVFGDKLFFCADDGTNGFELWVSNGTESGTYIFKDIWPGVNSAAPNNLFVLNDKLFFGAADGGGYGFWVSDGTPAGTTMLKRITFFFFGDDKSHMVALNKRVYFRASDVFFGDELWVSDGTSGGTQMLKDIYPGMYGGCNFNLYKVYNNKLYFVGTDDVFSSELWVTDGTSAGTKRITSASSWGAFSNATDFCEYKGSLYFSASLDDRFNELWKLTTNPSGMPGLQSSVSEIYPNPSVSTIHLTPIAGEKRYKVVNGEGRVLLSGEVGNTECLKIDISALTSGIYLLQTEIRNYKFIKKNE